MSAAGRQSVGWSPHPYLAEAEEASATRMTYQLEKVTVVPASRPDMMSGAYCVSRSGADSCECPLEIGAPMTREMRPWMEMVPGSPSFNPWWRWELAEWSVATSRDLPSRYHDEWVVKARDFLLVQHPRAGCDALVEAVGVFREGPCLHRDSLEAYLLTEAPLEIVAERCSLSVPTAEVFGRLFFDVRPRRRARDWVTLQVLGPGVFTGYRKQDLGQLWKTVGFRLGLLALDAVIAVCIQDGLVTAEPEVLPSVPEVADERLRQSVRLLLGAMMLPATTPFKQLAELHTQVQRMAAMPKSSPISSSTSKAGDDLLAALAAISRLDDAETERRSVM